MIKHNGAKTSPHYTREKLEIFDFHLGFLDIFCASVVKQNCLGNLDYKSMRVMTTQEILGCLHRNWAMMEE